MAGQVETWGAMILSAGGFGFLTNWIAGWYQRQKDREVNALGMAQLNQQAETDFQKMVLAELKETKAELKETMKDMAQLREQVATLTGKIQVLESSENHLKLENTRLNSENAALRSKNVELNDENEIQGQKIAELTGRLAVYEAQATTQAAVAAGAIPLPGDCP